MCFLCYALSLSTAQSGAQTSSGGSDASVAALAVLFALALLVIIVLIVAVVVLVVMLKRKQTFSKGMHAQLNANHLYECTVMTPLVSIVLFAKTPLASMNMHCFVCVHY